MAVIFTNDIGDIRISVEIIKQVAGLAAIESYGVIGMAAKDMKDGFVHLLLKESLTKGINVSVDDKKVTVEFHIIVRYGTNITAIAETIISSAKYHIEHYLDLEIDDIVVFVEDIRIDE